MAVTKTLVFQNILIASASGTGPNTYPLHVTESAEVTVEPVTDTVDDGQTLASAFDVSFTVNVYNTTLLADPFIYHDASDTPTRARIQFVGATGAQTLNIENVIINANRVFDGSRTAVQLTGSKRVTNAFNAVVVA